MYVLLSINFLATPIAPDIHTLGYPPCRLCNMCLGNIGHDWFFRDIVYLLTLQATKRIAPKLEVGARYRKNIVSQSE